MVDGIRKLQRPRFLECDYKTLTNKYGLFYAQPFERGYGVTIGNSLRRVLLSSIEGAAITAVKIEGVLHEFSSISGVFEDVTDIILNLKSIPIKLKTDKVKIMTLKAVGPGEVKSKDIIHDGDIEILDPNIHIATLDEDGKLEMEMRVKNNIGYVPADRNYDEDLSLGYIPLDSVHSPIKKVNYKVEPTRVGERTDYEKLIIEIWTNGAIHPQDAISRAAKILRDHLLIFMNFVDQSEELEVKPSKKEIPLMSFSELLAKPIEHLELSVRSNNCLKAAGVERIYELVQKNEDELLKTKNFGRKSLNEIKETLENLGLSLGVELHPKLLERIHKIIEKEESEDET
ncbi:DNA-directed RNA polymerase subunit alpha [Candidatus Aminicenantes bacterium AC-708-M15]|jgi:DNA-directed RNA polymerase subunit alpha|nr:DNA-directed RNA polymerase subunit alpha [SCandidatus Aminicenantes bacterium Aminicenantia_JdfR_composite]MCP2596383.1 DNA-directed RNA polymerase subunit alpha [Candidatus Aminicenantes bacterium AC-335-G13]MCP2598568.1 DNA-directed RNA polymerase subunit alpha [Candidatus Aminicenantes bacterium AC-335-L06]MCP2604088.1 DNA-directed RNA polymerase subunit alpha [Candidatus Aminicenantes bacterium AC-708-M15]MCP2605377.1 DNA-directed RNA polymerase subunit alpha [Candidatus Aminicenantes b